MGSTASNPSDTSPQFSAGVGLIAIAFTSLAFLMYWIGESFRHDAVEPGDATLGYAFGFGMTSIFIVLGGFLVRRGLRSMPERETTRQLAATLESAVGGIAVLWLLPVFTLPLAVASFRVAGSLRRQVRPEPKLRHLTGDARWDQPVARYAPYFITALVTCIVLWLGIWLVVVGGACHSYGLSGWTACERDGSFIGSVGAIGFLFAAAGGAVNIGYRLRGQWPRPGWRLAISVGPVFAGVVAISHVLP